MPTTKTIRILYFAALHDAAGRTEESWKSLASTAAELYTEVAARYSFPWDRSVLRVARNDEMAAWDTELRDGDSVAFLAPFAGG